MLVSRDTQFFEGVSVLVENDGCGKIVGNAECYQDTLEKVHDLFPDIILIDLENPVNKYKRLITELRKSADNTRILLVGQYSSSKVVFNGIKAGVAGYISRNDLSSSLPSAIMHVYQGRCFLSPPITTMIVNGCLKKWRVSEVEPYDKLTEREKEILSLLGKGYSSRVIAGTLNVSVKTILNQRSKINKKLNIHNTFNLIKYAISKQSTYSNQ